MINTLKAALVFLSLSIVLFLGSCAYRINKAIEWDHKNKCEAGLVPIDKKPCI